MADREVATWREALQIILLGLGLVIGLSLVLILQVLPSQVRLSEGDVASQDVLSPRDEKFESTLLTEQARDEAAAQVEDIYTSADPEIARKQADKTKNILAYLDSVRHDTYATPEEKVASIEAIPELDLPITVILQTLSLEDEAWQEVAADTVYVVEQVMRDDIRDQDLVDARRRVASFTSRELSSAQAEIVSEIAKDLIVPNSLYHAQQTEAARMRAREGVAPVVRVVKRGEVILQKGHVLDALDLETLEALGLRKTEIEWLDILGNIVLAILVVSMLVLYLLRLRPGLWIRQRQALLPVLLLLVSVLAAKLMVPGHAVLPYLLPAAAIPMLLAVLLSPDLAIMVAMVFSIIVGFLGGGSLELAVYAFAGGVIASLALWRIERFNAFIWAAGYLALGNIAVIAAFRLPGHDYDARGLLTLVGVAVVNSGLSVSLTLGGLFILGNVFGIITAFQLIDLAQPTQPPFRQILLKAPGTYHHSIIVSNLAERAAESIGADPLLARVGAYYHDIGKTLRPWLFSENQLDGVNPHDKLDPKTSARMIISHVKDGLNLAKKYGLPQGIQDFIAENHGTSLAGFFYQQALKEEGEDEVNEEDFRYPGPKPQSRETAIVMLADGCEAAVRAARPSSSEEIDKIVHKIINEKVLDGQLDECDLTLRDLERIREAFVNILQGIFHPRVEYPEKEAEEKIPAG